MEYKLQESDFKNENINSGLKKFFAIAHYPENPGTERENKICEKTANAETGKKNKKKNETV